MNNKMKTKGKGNKEATKALKTSTIKNYTYIEERKHTQIKNESNKHQHVKKTTHKILTNNKSK